MQPTSFGLRNWHVWALDAVLFAVLACIVVTYR